MKYESPPTGPGEERSVKGKGKKKEKEKRKKQYTREKAEDAVSRGKIRGKKGGNQDAAPEARKRGPQSL